MIKRLFFLSLMMGAVGVPYLVTSSSNWWGSFSDRWLSGGSAARPATAAAKPAGSLAATSEQQHLAAVPGKPFAANLPIEGAATHDLAEVIQFNGSPDWVMARWPRVTAGLSELDLQGYRVPLVTGTAQDDLAGSLTYYFDRNQQIARISFHGSTGDPRKLIALVTSRYSFLKQATNDPSLGLYQVKWNGKALSELRIRPARVVRADQPHARFEVDLAMKRP